MGYKEGGQGDIRGGRERGYKEGGRGDIRGGDIRREGEGYIRREGGGT